MCATLHWSFYDRTRRQVRDLSCGDMRIYLDFEVRRVECRSCGKVKRERLEFLADNPFYTKRFAYYVGRRWFEPLCAGLPLGAKYQVLCRKPVAFL